MMIINSIVTLTYYTAFDFGLFRKIPLDHIILTYLTLSKNLNLNEATTSNNSWTEAEQDPPLFEFIGQPQGLTLPPKLRTPGELIDLFLSVEFLDMMVEQTNQCFERNYKKKNNKEIIQVYKLEKHE